MRKPRRRCRNFECWAFTVYIQGSGVVYVNGGADLPARYANKPHPRAPTKKANAFFVGAPVPSPTGGGGFLLLLRGVLTIYPLPCEAGEGWGGDMKIRAATALFKTNSPSNVCGHAKFVYPCPHLNPSPSGTSIARVATSIACATRERGLG